MTAARPVDGVLFDVDDTLVDTRGAFVHGLTAVIHAYLPHQGDEKVAVYQAQGYSLEADAVDEGVTAVTRDSLKKPAKKTAKKAAKKS